MAQSGDQSKNEEKPKSKADVKPEKLEVEEVGAQKEKAEIKTPESSKKP
jgi:hypothetical protein